jgi:DNA gyrase/topoisomerase IV subunit B
MNKIFLSAKNNKTKVISADIDCGLKVMISAACLEPIFTGQAKEILSNAEMEPFARSVAKSTLDEWSKSNPQDLNKICKYLKEIADIRMKSEKEKSKITDKFAKSFTGYPSKYAPPEGKEHLEFIICEGDSAKGTIMDGRDVKRQGVFPIRGKIANAYSTIREKFLANQEVQGINKIILDGQYRKNYDPINDVKWEKIIFAADADIDGAHINALLLRFFLLYHPQLIEAGKVYKTVPPLFGVSVSKNKTAYFTERLDIVRYIQKEFVKNNQVLNVDGSSIPNKDLSVLLARNIDYTNEIDKIANTYAVDPLILEMVLVADMNKKSPAFLRKQIKSKYRFVTLEEKGGNMLIEGAVNGELYDTLYVTPELINECAEIIKILDENTDLYYKLNGEDVSLYTLMNTFENTSPKSIQRYKGLGEMDYKKLAESTIHPEGQRTLIQYTLQDAQEEIEAVRVYESNMKLILNEVGKVTRTELLG